MTNFISKARDQPAEQSLYGKRFFLWTGEKTSNDYLDPLMELYRGRSNTKKIPSEQLILSTPLTL